MLRADSNKKSKVLIVAYYFPPYPRVGGRRWAKHAKYLHRAGMPLEIICGEFLNQVSAWQDDIKEYEKYITRIELKPLYKPWFERHQPKSFIGKIKWQLSYQWWKKRKTRLIGNYRDTSTPNIESFWSIIQNKLNKGDIGTVILTAGPFNYTELLIRVKQFHPDIKCILDYRDPWEESLTGLTQKQYDHSINLRSRVHECVDLILTVNEDISNKIRLQKPPCEVFTLPHCVDEDYIEFSKLSFSRDVSRDFKLAYGGELYGGMEEQMKELVAFIKALFKKSSVAINVDLYVPYSSYETILDDCPNIKIHKALSTKEYKNVLLNCDGILLFKSPLSSEAFFSSKFYEILCFNKPIVFFGPDGSVSKFIELNQRGVHYSAENPLKSLDLIEKYLKTGCFEIKPYNVSLHSFEYYTDILIKKLEL